jgi:hypothetical protein
MTEALTKAQRDGLQFIADSIGGVSGPAPGWNADIVLERDDVVICDGSDLAALFALGFVTDVPAPLPHYEQFNEASGSITCDRLYRITDAGRAALTTKENSNAE